MTKRWHSRREHDDGPDGLDTPRQLDQELDADAYEPMPPVSG